MLVLPDTAGRTCDSEASFKDTDFTTPDGRKVSTKSIIDQANIIPLQYLFKEFNIPLDMNNRKTRCLFHHGGNERSASFYFYPDSNRFHCFGCNKTGLPTDLVALIKRMSKLDAAVFILEKFAGHINPSDELSETKDIFSNDIVVEFSNTIRDFIKSNGVSPEAVTFAEKLCYSFDTINEKHSLDHAGLVRLIGKLRVRLEQYK